MKMGTSGVLPVVKNEFSIQLETHFEIKLIYEIFRSQYVNCIGAVKLVFFRFITSNKMKISAIKLC